MDPLGLQDQDISAIVTELRRMRQVWAQAEAQGKKQSPAKGPAQPKVKLSLGDLGL